MNSRRLNGELKHVKKPNESVALDLSTTRGLRGPTDDTQENPNNYPRA